jgi:hypothetical protein
MFECFGVFSRGTGLRSRMSRRTVTNRRELLLPSVIPNRHQKWAPFDSCVSPPVVAPINRVGEEPPRCWTRQTNRRPAKQVIATSEVAGLELTGANRLLARLVMQQVRPRIRSVVIEGQGCSSGEPQVARVPASAADVPSALTGEAVSPDESTIPRLEALFTQLARRRLRSRAREETR